MLKKLMLLIAALLIIIILFVGGYVLFFFKPQDRLEDLTQYLNKNYNINLTLNNVDYKIFPRPAFSIGEIIIKDEKQLPLIIIKNMKAKFNLFNNITISASDMSVGEVFNSSRFNRIFTTGIMNYGKINNPVTKFFTKNKLNFQVNNFNMNNEKLLTNWKIYTNFNVDNSLIFSSRGLVNSLPFDSKGEIRVQDKIVNLSIKGNYDENMHGVFNKYLPSDKLNGTVKVDFDFNSQSSNNLMDFINNMKGSINFKSQNIVYNYNKGENTLIGNVLNPFFKTFYGNKVDMKKLNFSLSVIDYKRNRYVFAGEFESNNVASNSIVKAAIEGYIEGDRFFSKQDMILENLSSKQEQTSSWTINDKITYLKSK